MSKKIAFVTGASSGIGEATVNRLIADGFYVMAVARRKDRLEKFVSAWGDRCMISSVDVTKEDQVMAAVDETIAVFGGIDVLVNNAGVGSLGPMAEGALADWHRMVDVNVKGVLNCLHACLPSLTTRRGHIINIASVAAHDVFPNAVVYCATKHAVNALTVGFRKEFRDRIKITNISPGPVDTEFVDGTPDGAFKEQFEKNFDGIVIKSSDIADAISYILHQPDHLVVNEYIIRPNK